MPPISEKYAGDPSLGVVGMAIDHGGGRLLTDPNGLIAAVFDGTLDALVPVKGVPSVISGGDAVLFTNDEYSVGLTTPELRRLIMRCFSPGQYFSFRQSVGVVFEIGGEFYDPRSGYALQPKEDHDELPAEIRRINFGP